MLNHGLVPELWYLLEPWGDTGDGRYEFSIPLPSPDVLRYCLLGLLAIASLGVAALALLRTS